MEATSLLLLAGVGLYALYKGGGALNLTSGAGATTPTPSVPVVSVDPAHLATSTSTAVAQLPPLSPTPASSQLEGVLDQAESQVFREYAALNPDDYQNWLSSYANYFVQMANAQFYRLTTPTPSQGFQLTPSAIAAFGVVTANAILHILNNMPAGAVSDLFGVTKAVATNQAENSDFTVSVNAAQKTYGICVAAEQCPSLTKYAYDNIFNAKPISTADLQIEGDVPTVPLAPSPDVADVQMPAFDLSTDPATAADQLGGIGSSEAVDSIASGDTELIDITGDLDAASSDAVASIGGVSGQIPLPSMMTVLAEAGLAVDIGFTIAGNAPDAVKAIDVALDTAAIVALATNGFWGPVVAAVISLVKFLFDAFGSSLFGGGLTHAQREMLEAALYEQRVSPMFSDVAHALTPRECLKVIISWGSGYCGGTHNVAMGINIRMMAGETCTIAGKPVTVPSNVMIGLAAPGCYTYQGTWLQDATFDDLAWMLGAYATKNGVVAVAQEGVSEAYKAQVDGPMDQAIQNRMSPCSDMIWKHHYTLDQIDAVIAEYRLQPRLHTIAQNFGYPKWQTLVGLILEHDWAAYVTANPHGSLSDFAKRAGYKDMVAYRWDALSTYTAYSDRAEALRLAPAQFQASLDAQAAYWLSQQTVPAPSGDAP